MKTFGFLPLLNGISAALAFACAFAAADESGLLSWQVGAWAVAGAMQLAAMVLALRSQGETVG